LTIVARDAGSRTIPMLPFALLVVGTTLIASVFVLGWYQVTEAWQDPACSSVQETLDPLWVTVTSAGSSCSYGAIGSYAQAGLGETGWLYLVTAVLTGSAVALGVVATFAFARGSGRSISRTVPALALGCVLLAGIAPILLATGQPSTICADQGFVGTPFALPALLANGSSLRASASTYPPSCDRWNFWNPSSQGYGTQVGGVGPWSSFAGGYDEPGGSFHWGPGPGMYFVGAGAVAVVLGAILGRRTGTERPGRRALA
jgi:hypothetical protein